MTEPTLLGWYSRVDHTERFGGLAGHACAAHLAAGDAEDALIPLDRGRGLLLAPVWGLASRAEALPDRDLKLYREALWSSFRADQAVEAATDPLAAGPLAPRASLTDRGYVDPREHRQAAGRILAVHTSRLAPQRVDVKALAGRLGTGAAVAINVTALRGDALIVTSQGVEAVPLPGLTPDAAESYAQRLHKAVVNRTEESLVVLDEVTRWIWDTLAAPCWSNWQRSRACFCTGSAGTTTQCERRTAGQSGMASSLSWCRGSWPENVGVVCAMGAQ